MTHSPLRAQLRRMVEGWVGKGSTRNARVGVSYARRASALQWELGGVTTDGEFGWGHYLELAGYMADLPGINIGQIKEKFSPFGPQARYPRSKWSCSISLTVYLPLIWFSYSPDGFAFEGWAGDFW